MKKIFAAVFLVFLLLFNGCTSKQAVSNKPVKKDLIEKEFFLCSSDTNNEDVGDLYIKKEVEDKVKISSDVIYNYFKYLPEREAIIYLDKDSNMYIKEKDKEKEKIVSNVVIPYLIKVTKDESKVFF